MPKVLAIEPTPNVNAMKFTIEGKAIESGSATIKAENADSNPIAQAVFAIPGVKAVFLLNDFVTVTKEADADWDDLKDKAADAISSV